MDYSTLKISYHAFSRMNSINISPTLLAKIISCGQIYSRGKRHKAMLCEQVGKNDICYEAIFSKATNTIITVWSTTKPHKKDFGDEYSSRHANRKMHKFRKNAIFQQDFEAYCREEFSNYNMHFNS